MYPQCRHLWRGRVQRSRIGSELELLSRELVCARCGARAFYRQRTRDGKAACFGSNDHQPGCVAATDPAPRARVDDPLASLDTIHVDLDVPTSPTGLLHGPAPPADTAEREPCRGGVTSRSLRTLLRHIVTEPAFLYSDAIVHAAGFPPLPAREFFVRFEQITTRHVGQDRGYWGTVISVGRSVGISTRSTGAAGSGSDLWLNAGPPGEPSVLITHADTAEDLIGGYVLTLGRCSTSTRGKVYINPRSSQHLTFRV